MREDYSWFLWAGKASLGTEAMELRALFWESWIGEFDEIDFVVGQVAGGLVVFWENVGWADCARLAGWERWDGSGGTGLVWENTVQAGSKSKLT